MDHLQAARTALDHLVAFDTTSSRSNSALTQWVADRVARPGVEVWDLPDPQQQSDGTVLDQRNLLVRIGPEAPGAWVLSAHTDCVPTTGQPWTSDPYVVTERDGRLYGRGTCDMKGFLAVAMAVLDGVDPSRLRVPIVLALSHSEELGTIGAPPLVADLGARIEDPELAIVGEPTMMEVVAAHKGVRGAWVTIDGVDNHSSQPQRGASATFAAARLIAAIEAMADRHAVEGPHDERFDPPMTTFNVGILHAGEAINIIPRQARFHVEYRPIPAVAADAPLEELRRTAEGDVLARLARHVGTDAVGMSIAPDAKVLALHPEQDGAAEALARSCGATGRPEQTVAYGTDGGWLQQAGLSVVVCGPGSIDQAHRPDEYLALDQLEAAVGFVEQLVSRASSAG